MARSSVPSFDDLHRDSAADYLRAPMRLSRPSRPTRPTIEPMRVEPPRKRPKKHRFLRKFLLGMGVALGVPVVVATALVLNINSEAERRWVAKIVSNVASKNLRGSIEIDDLQHVGLHGIDVGAVRIRDPQGRPVIVAEGAHVGFDLFTLGKGFLTGVPVHVVDAVRVDRLDVALVDDGNGSPTLGQAFAPKEPSPPSAPNPKGLRLVVADLDVREIRVVGNVTGKKIAARGDLHDAAISVEPEGTRLAIPSLAVDAMPIAGVLSAPVKLRVATDVVIPALSDPRNPGVDLRALAAEVESAGATVDVAGTMVDGHLDLHVDGSAGPDAVSTFMGSKSSAPPLWAPVDVHADVGGTMQLLDLVAMVKTPAGSARFGGEVSLETLQTTPTKDRPRLPLAKGSVRLDGLAVRTFAPTAPPIHANADLSLVATATTEGTEISVTSHEQPLAAIVTDPFAPAQLPSIGETIVAVDARALLKKTGDVEATGSLHASLERARLDVDGSYKGGIAEAHVKLDAPSLGGIRALKLPVRGGVKLALEAKANVPAKTFTAEGTVTATEIIQGNLKVPSVAVNLSAQGTFDEPQFTVKLFAPEVQQMAETTPSKDDAAQLKNVSVVVIGTKGALGVQASLDTMKHQHVVVSTHLVPDKTGMRVVALDGDVMRDAFHAKIHVDEVKIANGDVTVKGMRLSSTAGGMRLDAAFSPKKHRLDLDVASTDLDVNQLAYGAGVDDALKKVKLTVKLAGALHTFRRDELPPSTPTAADADGAFAVDGDHPVGIPTARPLPHDAPALVGALDVTTKGTIQLASGEKKLDGALSLTFDDRYVKTSVRGSLEDVLGVGVYGGGTLGGRWDDPQAWRDLVGHVDLHVPNVDLEKVASFVEQLTGRPLGASVGGKITVNAHVERPEPTLPPVGDVELLGEKVKGSRGSMELDPLDFDVRARLMRTNDPKKAADEMIVALFAHVKDAGGKLLSLDADTRARWATLTHLSDAGQLTKDALDLPTYVRLEIPARPISKLPAPLKTMIPLDGVLGVKLAVDGTVSAPHVALDASLAHVKAANGPLLTAAVHSTYDGDLSKTELTIKNEKAPPTRKPELDVVADVSFKEAQLLDGTKSPDWTAKVDGTLNGLPLAMFSSLAAESVGGLAYGELHVDHVHDPKAKAASAAVKIDVDALTIGDAVFDTTKVALNVDDKHATADVSLDGQSGSLKLTGDVPLQWKDATTPTLPADATIRGSFATKDLRLRVAEPFVSAMDQLDGLLDSDVKIAITPKKVNGKTTLTGGADGTLKVRDGVMIVGAIGEPWKNVNGEIRISPTKVEIPKLTVHGLTGSMDMSANATLENLIPKAFHVELDPDRLPFASNGVPIGALSGKIGVDGTIDPKMITTNVTIDGLTVDLAPSSDKHPQDLEAEPSIVIQQPVEPPKAPPSPGGTPMKIAINIKNDIWVRRDDLHLAVTGNPTIEVKDVARFTGMVQVDPTVNPWVEQFGKRFYIQKADVKFDGGAELDPVLDVAVLWTSRDGTNVTISVGGRLKQPKVTMTADPPATQAEIMSLLVLGRRDAGSASQQDQAQRGAAAQTASLVEGMTGAIIGQQLQKMLPTSMTLDFQPGDSGFSDARYAGGYQWNNVYFEVGYNAGAGNATAQPMSAAEMNARTTFGVDWRFKPEWSLMTTLGDTGSALVDLLWNFRY